MKKYLIVAFLLLVTFIISISSIKKIEAESYQYYQEINFDSENIKMLDEWSDIDLYSNMAKLPSKRKMFGWYTKELLKKEHFSFLSETIYIVRNTGNSTVEHTFKYEEMEESQIQKTVTGKLGVSVSKQNKSKLFKFGLDNELKYEYKESIKNKVTETDTVKIKVGPNSELKISVIGEGYLYQGVAKKYVFWCLSNYGGYEYVIITNQSFEIDIHKIGEDISEEIIEEEPNNLDFKSLFKGEFAL